MDQLTKILLEDILEIKNQDYIIYFDIDDTLTDYSNRLGSMIITDPETGEERPIKASDTVDNIEFWTSAKWLPGSQQMLDFAKNNFSNVEILSAVPELSKANKELTGKRFFDAPIDGKTEWLNKNVGPIKTIWTKSGKEKAIYATPNTVLVDDKPENIKAFEQAGGIGILMDTPQNVINKLSDLLEGKDMVQEGIIDNMKTKIKDFIAAIKQEGKETRDAFKLILQSAKGDITLTDEQKEQIGNQLKDVLKTIGLTAIAVLPGGVIVAALLKIFKQSHLVTPSAFVNEGTISLTNNEEQSLKDLIPVFIQALKDKNFNVALTSPIKYKMSSGEEALFRPYIYTSKDNSAAHWRTEDPNDFEDNLIGINGTYWYPAFEGTLEGIWKKLTGDNPKESLLSSLRHELIHGKDPAANQKPIKAKYDPSKPELYFGNWLEFPTQTGEFLEAIKVKSYDYLNNNLDNLNQAIPQLNSYYQDILDFYSGKDKQFDKETANWLAGGEKGNAVQKFIRKVADWGGYLLGAHVNPGWDSKGILKQFEWKIDSIRKYNPEGYKEFQKDLYKTIQNIIDNINKQLPKDTPVKLKAGGQGKLTEDEINEVGEASLKPYKWEETDREGYWIYTRFTTDSETQYYVDLEITTYLDDDSNLLKALGIEFSAKPKGFEGSSSKIVVNKGEMYRVMSTIADIVKKYIKKFKAQAVMYSPSKKGNEDFGTQRDNLYKAFISKAFPGVKFEQDGEVIAAILPNSVNEIVTDTEVICDNCGWEWPIADGGDDLYICHKCGHDNNPNLEEGRKKKSDPKKGTGKKPEGSGRRLYTDEDPKDTVRIKFKTKEDIVDTLNKKQFKAKSHARQSQVINLIHQRVRAAYGKAKDPDVKARLKRALDYIESRKESSKEKTERLRKMKEASDPQAGTALPYGSGFAPIKENDPFGLNEAAKNFAKEVLDKTWNLKDGFVSLSKYMIDNGMNIKPLPKIKVIKDDEENASNLLGKTAYYDPNEKSITLFTMNRHPKDILRSFAHEMIHHEQNLDGRLGNITTTNTNEDGDLPEIEKEAYEKGNMMLRNWEDNIKNV